MNNQRDIQLYFHLPFCKHRCKYCGFYSTVDKLDKVGEYFNSLGKELKSYEENGINSTSILNSIYFGGGTPSLVDSKYIVILLEQLRENWNFKEDIEITIEANPEQITGEKLRDYKKAGINRISMGLQSSIDSVLKNSGRKYIFDEFLRKYHLVRESGFTNVGIDLIIGLPGHSIKNWELNLNRVLEIGPEHISCYSLELDNKSYWGVLHEKGLFEEIPEKVDRKLYWETVDRLKKAGYIHYEISNFARKGYECKYNLAIWHNKEYIGIGAGASSYLNSKRFSNPDDIESYLKGTYTRDNLNLSAEDIRKETIMLNFRLLEGIPKENLMDHISEVSEAMNKGLVIEQSNKYVLTRKGIDLWNDVIADFL